MAALARGEYLLLLNNDAALFPEALPTLHAEAARLNRPAILTLPQYDAESGQLLDIGSLLDPFLNPVPNLDPDRSEVGMVMGACLWIPKTLWEELGGFPEWFGSIGEDLYLCCLARLWGYPVRAVAKSGYHHHVGKSFGGGKLRNGRLTTRYQRRALSERNKTMVMLICAPITLAVVQWPLHFMLIYLEGFLISILKRDRKIWKDIYAPLLSSLWSHRNRLSDCRAKAQSGRKISTVAWLTPMDWVPWKMRLLFRHGLPRIGE